MSAKYTICIEWKYVFDKNKIFKSKNIRKILHEEKNISFVVLEIYNVLQTVPKKVNRSVWFSRFSYNMYRNKENLAEELW